MAKARGRDSSESCAGYTRKRSMTGQAQNFLLCSPPAQPWPPWRNRPRSASQLLLTPSMERLGSRAAHKSDHVASIRCGTQLEKTRTAVCHPATRMESRARKGFSNCCCLLCKSEPTGCYPPLLSQVLPQNLHLAIRSSTPGSELTTVCASQNHLSSSCRRSTVPAHDAEKLDRHFAADARNHLPGLMA